MLRKSNVFVHVRTFTSSRVLHKSDEPKDIEDPKLLAQRALDEFRKRPKFQNPITRTGKMVKRDFKFIGQTFKVLTGLQEKVNSDAVYTYFPSFTDVVIIGGGATGAAIAYWLSQRTRKGMHITVVDQISKEDESPMPYITQGNLCHQHVLPEKVQMSMFCAEFFRNCHRNLKVDGFPEPDIQYEPMGSLYLADKDGEHFLAFNADVQERLGVKNILMNPNELKSKFPWLNVDDVALGCLGLSNEGRFNPLAMINAFKQSSVNNGVEFVDGRAIGFEFQKNHHIEVMGEDDVYQQLERLIVLLPDGQVQPIKFGLCVLAAGLDSAELGYQALMGEGKGVLAVDLPIAERKRAVHYFECPHGPGLDVPLISDSSGIFFQRIGFGGNYVAGVTSDEEQNTDFESVRQRLINRVPTFSGLSLKDTKVGKFECNILDDNGIFGNHPYYHNLMLATGFCGHSSQFAPAVGRAMMELILDGEYKTINLSRFNFERLCLDEPLIERPREFIGEEKKLYVS